jgi:hypothetical protein
MVPERKREMTGGFNRDTKPKIASEAETETHSQDEGGKKKGGAGLNEIKRATQVLHDLNQYSG